MQNHKNDMLAAEKKNQKNKQTKHILVLQIIWLECDGQCQNSSWA